MASVRLKAACELSEQQTEVTQVPMSDDIQ